MQNHKIIKPLILLIFFAVAGLAIGFYVLFQPKLLYLVYVHASYYLMGFLFFLWVTTIVRFIRDRKFSIQQWIFENRYGMGLAFLITTVLFVTVPPDYRVLNDETNLVASSRSMYYEGRVDMAHEAEWGNEKLKPISWKISPKLVLFSFFIYLIHLISGYRPENAFVLNFLVLSGFLSMLYAFLKNHIGPRWSAITLILIASQPVVSLTASSAIYDLFAVFFIALCFFSLNAYLQKPDEISFRLLWIHLIMLAHIRQESVLFLLITLGSLVLLRQFPFRSLISSWVYVLTPLFLFPILWCRALLPQFFPNYFQAPSGITAFSLEHSLRNSLEFVQGLLRFDFYLPFANLVCLGGLFSILLLGTKFENLLRGRALVFISLLNVTVIWILHTSYFVSPLNAGATRHYLLFIVLLTIAFVFLLRKIPFINSKPAAAFGIAFLMFLIYHPVAMEGRILKEGSFYARDYRLIRSMVKPLDKEKTLLIVWAPSRYIIHNFAAIGLSRAHREKKRLLTQMEQGVYRNIYAIQGINPTTSQPVPGSNLPSEFPLEKIAEHQNKPSNLLRLSKVVAPDPFLGALRKILSGEKPPEDVLQKSFLESSLPKDYYGISLVLYEPGQKRVIVARPGQGFETLNIVIQRMKVHPRISDFHLSDPAKSRIQIDFFSNELGENLTFDQLKPAILSSERFEMGVDGLRMSDGNQVRYFLPGDAFVFSILDQEQLRRHIRKNFEGIPFEKIHYKRFTSQSYISYGAQWLPLYRGYPVLGPLTCEKLQKAAQAGIDYIVRNQKKNGQFLYYYNAAKDSHWDHEHPKRNPARDPYYNELRHEGAILLLLQDYKQSKNAKLLPAIRSALDFLVNLIVPYTLPEGQKAGYVYYNQKAKLGGQGLGLYVLSEYRRLTGDTRYQAQTNQLYRHLIAQVLDTGEFMYYSMYLDQAIRPQHNQQLFNFYYPGEALVGLIHYYQFGNLEDKEKTALQGKLHLALRFLLEMRPKLYPHQFTTLPSDSWLMMAISNLWDSAEMRQDHYKNFVYAEAEKMVSHMYTPEDALYPDYPGSFYYSYGDFPYADGARAEGLMAAYELAIKAGDKTLAEKFMKALERAAWATLHLCNTEESVYSVPRPDKTIGAIRFKHTRQWFRVDTIQHVAAFYLKLLPYLKD